MRTVSFAEAIEKALARAMADDPRIIIMGEDVHTIRRNLFVRFGKDRVRAAPISESAFVGAAVTAAMAGLRPVVEVMIVDFICVGVHRALEAAERLQDHGISAGVIDLRTVSPLDRDFVCASVARTGGMLVVDEDYKEFGLSGELAASVMEAGLTVKFARVATEETIPYARHLEEQVLPNTMRIVDAAQRLLND